MNAQRICAALGFVMLLAGCSATPPPPPGVKGEYRPINTPDTKPPTFLTPKVFDFKYRGDPEYALRALQQVQPQLIVLPTEGKRQQAAIVDVDFRQVTLENALKRLGEQGRRSFEIVYKPDPANGQDYAYVKYRP